MPYALDVGLSALTRQPDSLVHSLSRQLNWLSLQPWSGRRFLATSLGVPAYFFRSASRLARSSRDLSDVSCSAWYRLRAVFFAARLSHAWSCIAFRACSTASSWLRIR